MLQICWSYHIESSVSPIAFGINNFGLCHKVSNVRGNMEHKIFICLNILIVSLVLVDSSVSVLFFIIRNGLLFSTMWQSMIFMM